MNTGASEDASPVAHKSRDDLQRVVVIGLGYVGLPLAVCLANSFCTIGIDINKQRVEELQRNVDRTGEVSPDKLNETSLQFSSDPADGKAADVYIVTVPTPVDEHNRPDLRALIAASEMVGGLLDGSRRPIVIFESTVYPGVTEEICVPAIEAASGLQWKRDFFVGYSPERINPGDRERTIDRIVKVVSGDTPGTTECVADLYGRITTGGTFRAASIKAAEGAKALENAQRDVNIAFVNEAARIFAKLDVSIWDVLEAAKTKWNFLPFQPGLVGGHCIGVDPYYLSHRSIELGHTPEVITAARSVNDDMSRWLADTLSARMRGRRLNVLMMGITFKEDVPDIRNSKAIDIINRLKYHSHNVTVHDPIAHADDLKSEYGVDLDPSALQRSYDLVIVAVPHRQYVALESSHLEKLVSGDGLIADVKGVFRDRHLSRPYWTM